MDLLLFMVYCHGLLLLFTPKCAKTMGTKDGTCPPIPNPLLPPNTNGIPQVVELVWSKKHTTLPLPKEFLYVTEDFLMMMIMMTLS